MVSTLRVAKTLLRQGMPLGEIRAVLTTEDPVVVRRYLELHKERMQESLAEKSRNLAVIAELLTCDGPSPVCAIEGDVSHLTKVSVQRR